jgi:hypothetical protein
MKTECAYTIWFASPAGTSNTSRHYRALLVPFLVFKTCFSKSTRLNFALCLLSICS